MEQEQNETSCCTLTPLRTGDPNTLSQDRDADAVRRQFRTPFRLLSSSHKTDKCSSVSVLVRALYLTPGLLCPNATESCLAACLGHSIGRMHIPAHAVVRDTRTAFYLEQPKRFISRLSEELHCLIEDAHRLSCQPAVRLNGTSDIPWERIRPELFAEFRSLQFYDYTKSASRMTAFLGESSWPSNYHLTFSAALENHGQARELLAAGGTVAVVFWHQLPQRLWDFPVVDGDAHDARFLDPHSAVIGLRAKGAARVDLHGFTVRLCPGCHPEDHELELLYAATDTHLSTTHQCPKCQLRLRDRYILPPGPAPAQKHAA